MRPDTSRVAKMGGQWVMHGTEVNIDLPLGDDEYEEHEDEYWVTVHAFIGFYQGERYTYIHSDCEEADGGHPGVEGNFGMPYAWVVDHNSEDQEWSNLQIVKSGNYGPIVIKNGIEKRIC